MCQNTINKHSVLKNKLKKKNFRYCYILNIYLVIVLSEHEENEADVERVQGRKRRFPAWCLKVPGSLQTPGSSHRSALRHTTTTVDFQMMDKVKMTSRMDSG